MKRDDRWRQSQILDPPEGSTEVLLFPLRLQTAFVRQVVDELKALPTQRQRDDRMIWIVGSKFEDAVTIVDDDRAIERDLIEFADEVWTQLRGEKRGGAA